MISVLQYKNYIGSIEFSVEDNVLYGKVLGIRSLISYEGTTVAELVEDFHGAIDDYLKICEEEKVEPEIPYKGSFNVRVSPELHREIAIRAKIKNISLNSFVEKALQAAIS